MTLNLHARARIFNFGCDLCLNSSLIKLFNIFARRKAARMSTKVSEIDIYFNTVLNYVKKAGELILQRTSDRNKKVDIKSSNRDFVTETDKEVEKLLINGLSSQFPDHQFIGEESVAEGEDCNLTNAPTWIIDPVDGTMNFVHGFPHSCISIALFINQRPEIAVIHNPMMSQLFTARRDVGAYLNGDRIKVSGETDLSKAVLMMELGTSRNENKEKITLENFKNLTPIIQGFRSLGSAALDAAMVAMGAADGYFEFGIHVWDIAAAELLVTEAGGVVMDPSGGPLDRMSRRVLFASSQKLAEQMVQKLVQFYPQPRD